MKRIAVVLAVLFAATFAAAQNSEKVEVFGGYQFTSVDFKGAIDRQSFNGWNADVAARVAKNVSAVADFSGAYKGDIEGSGVDAKIHSFLFGPRVSVTSGKLTPFAQVLFGVSHLNAEGPDGASVNKFGMTLGGGVDYSIGRNVAWRVAKVDYFMIHADSENLNNVRIATGIVFKF